MYALDSHTYLFVLFLLIVSGRHRVSAAQVMSLIDLMHA